MLTAKHAGYGIIVGPDGIQEEHDTETCQHCNRVWVTRSTNDGRVTHSGGKCSVCMQPICPTCVGQECVPIEKRLDQIEMANKLAIERQFDILEARNRIC
jgi:hypothetical protein